jgi:RhoGAP domain
MCEYLCVFLRIYFFVCILLCWSEGLFVYVSAPVSSPSFLSLTVHISLPSLLSLLPHSLSPLSFLAEVAALSEFNSMDVSNLASIFSPTVMRPPMDSESLQNAFQELRRSKNILKLLLTQATIAKNAEKRGSKEITGVKKEVTNDPSLSVENLHTNSILLGAVSPNVEKTPSSPFSKSSPKLNSLYPVNSTAPMMSNPLKVSPQKSALSLTVPADAFITNRKRLNNRPMSVSLDSSMLSSFLGATDTSSGGKLSPIREHDANPTFLPETSKDGSLSSNHDGKERGLLDKGRNSMGSATMKSLPVKKLITRARPMSTSAATSTSLSYFLKMFMSPRETADGPPTVVVPMQSPSGSRPAPNSAPLASTARQMSVPPSSHRRATPVITAKLSRP